VLAQDKLKLSLGRKEESEVVQMLQKVPIFSGLDRKRLRRMAKSFHERDYRVGETIVKEGESSVAFYLIFSGSVDVTKGKKNIARFGRGQYFGEMSLLDEQPRSASVVAREPTRCLLMTTWSFIGYLKTDPNMAIGMLKELAGRLRATSQALSE
jgi:CRP/FNR family transcriptional regulator, cyclic AMP receptor protein